jgi:hypothetical protein
MPHARVGGGEVVIDLKRHLDASVEGAGKRWG